MHLRPLRAVLTAVSAFVLIGGAAAVTSDGASATPTGAAEGVHYAVDRPACPAPRPGEFTCYAVVQRPAAKGTTGAYPLTGSGPAWAQGPAGGLTPKALATAYGYDPNLDRVGQTVAIVDWYDDPNVRTDLNHFDAQYGLPAETYTTFRKVNQNGAAHPLPHPDVNLSVEITLDVQAVRAVCHLCHIVLVEASAPNSTALGTAENTAVRLHATEVSNSWGAPEQRGHALPAGFRAAFFHKGVVITASTGDDGWDFWDGANQGSRPPGTPSFPATSGGVVSVGGTQLNLAANGHRSSEPAWNDNGKDDNVGDQRNRAMGAAGSGCSTYFAAQYWQRGLTNYAAAGCGGKRLASDVSADAAPATGLDIYDSYGEPGWIRVGGTSLSSPLIAAMFALAQGSGGIDYPAHTLYRNHFARPQSLFDPQSGGTSWCGGDTLKGCSAAVKARDSALVNPNVYAARLYGGSTWPVDCSYPASGPATRKTPDPECNAVSGYDGPTGVGTPRSLTAFQSPVPHVTLHLPPHPAVGHPAPFSATVTDPVGGAHVVKYVWHWGDNRGPTTTTVNHATHTYNSARTYSTYVTITDSVGQTATDTGTIRVTG